MMLSGFFSNDSNFLPYLIPFKYISLFKYSYEILVYNEFKDNEPFVCSAPPNNCDTFADLNLKQSIATSFAVASSVGVFYLLIAFFVVYFFVKVKN